MVKDRLCIVFAFFRNLATFVMARRRSGRAGDKKRGRAAYEECGRGAGDESAGR